MTYYTDFDSTIFRFEHRTNGRILYLKPLEEGVYVIDEKGKFAFLTGISINEIDVSCEEWKRYSYWGDQFFPHRWYEH